MLDGLTLLLDDFKGWVEGRTWGGKETAKKYVADAKQFVAKYGHPQHASPQTINQWFEAISKSVARSTANRKLAAIKALFRFLRVRGIRADDPTTDVEVHTLELPLPKPIEHSEILRIVTYIREHLGDNFWMRQDLALMEILYGSGLRRSECATLRLTNIRSHDCMSVVGKRHKERLTIITKPEFDAIAAWTVSKFQSPATNQLLQAGQSTVDVFWSIRRDNPNAPLFYTRKNRPFLDHKDPGHYVYLRVKEYGKLLGIEIQPHRLRHSFATELDNNGADLGDIAEVMGHEDMRTTRRYSALNQKGLRAILRHHSRTADVEGV
jgi:site-specific recombinase XerD